jgi:predicted dehydrogenase
MRAVRWGLLSTASIGAVVARATRTSHLTRFVAVASRDGARAREFAEAAGIEHSFPSYEAMLESDDVDAVYVALPVSMHTEWTVRALEAGKHVLCEKPFATSAADATKAFDAAAHADRLCVEGLMYRYHPQTTLAQRLVDDGAIGELQTVRAALSVNVGPDDIRRSPTLGGGSLLDLGCYCASAVRLFAGEPERVYAEAVRDADGVDLRVSATLRMPAARLGLFDLGLTLTRRDELELIGTEGKIVVSDPWICRSKTVELRRDGRSEHLPIDPQGSQGLEHAEDDVYRIELDAVSAAVAGRTEVPFGRHDAIAQARVLEALRESSLRARPVDVAPATSTST